MEVEFRGQVLDAPTGEMRREVPLSLAEERDPVAPGRHEPIVHEGGAADRDDTQQRLQRTRHECVGGHTEDLAVDARRDHGDARRETGHHVAEHASWIFVGLRSGCVRRHGVSPSAEANGPTTKGAAANAFSAPPMSKRHR